MTEQQIVEYKPEGSSLKLDVLYREDEFWFTQGQIAELFETSIQNANYHICRYVLMLNLTENELSKIF